MQRAERFENRLGMPATGRQRAGALVGPVSFRVVYLAEAVSREPKFENRLGCPATGHGPARRLAQPRLPFLALTLQQRAGRFENRLGCPAR